MSDTTGFPLSIGALAESTGTSPETIRYYERQGLLDAPPRSAGGHRQYGPAHLRGLSFILRARRLGFSQDEVRELVSLAASGGRDCNRVQRLAEQHLRDIQEKLQDLRRLESALTELVGECRRNASMASCPVVDALLQPLGRPDSG